MRVSWLTSKIEEDFSFKVGEIVGVDVIHGFWTSSETSQNWVGGSALLTSLWQMMWFGLMWSRQKRQYFVDRGACIPITSVWVVNANVTEKNTRSLRMDTMALDNMCAAPYSTEQKHMHSKQCTDVNMGADFDFRAWNGCVHECINLHNLLSSCYQAPYHSTNWGTN